MDMIELSKLIDDGNRYTVRECNSLSRSLDVLRRMHHGITTDAEYMAMLDGRVCVAIRLEDIRQLVAKMTAPWFEVQQ